MSNSKAPLRIFVGFDPRQPVSYNVLQQSLFLRSSKPLAITPLVIQQLPIKRVGLTPFTWTRFLVPWLCRFRGQALFLDADMLVLGDIAELFTLADKDCAVQVADVVDFERASAMLFNCAHKDNRVLTPRYIEEANGLHGIKWTENMGFFPSEWNHIVLYNEPRDDAKLVHYTAGIPPFPETSGCEYTDEWMREAEFMTSAQPWRKLMGNSRHVGRVQKMRKKLDAPKTEVHPG